MKTSTAVVIDASVGISQVIASPVSDKGEGHWIDWARGNAIDQRLVNRCR
jgi:hypothetical protein